MRLRPSSPSCSASPSALRLRAAAFACILLPIAQVGAQQTPTQAVPPPAESTPQSGTRTMRPVPQQDAKTEEPAAEGSTQQEQARTMRLSSSAAQADTPTQAQQADRPSTATAPSAQVPVPQVPPANAVFSKTSKDGQPAAAQAQPSAQPPPEAVQQAQAPAAQVQPLAQAQGDAASVPAADGVATGARGILFKLVPPPIPFLPVETVDPASGEVVMSEPPPPVPPSYLMATIHFGTPQEQGIDYAAIEPFVREAAVFVNETDADEPWQDDYNRYRWMDEATPLSGMLGKADFRQLRKLLPNVEADSLDRSKPWAILALLEARGEHAGEHAMDSRLEAMAAGFGLHVVHLETLQAQLQALDCVPAEEQAAVLQDRIRAPDVLAAESAQALLHYRTRDLAAWLADIDRMQGLSERGRGIEQRARHCLIEQRNAAWLAPLKAQLAQGGRFVAVGAIHLPGENGLIAALRREGYTVEALPL